MSNELQELIKKQNFKWVSPEIKGSFPDNGERGRDYKLFVFTKYIFSRDVIKEMKKEGYRPVNIYELLGWQGWNGIDSVVALGSLRKGLEGHNFVAIFDSCKGERRLDFNYWEGEWCGFDYFFLAVLNYETK